MKSWGVGFLFSFSLQKTAVWYLKLLQAYLRDMTVLVPDHPNTPQSEYCNKMSYDLSAGGGSCLPFVKHATSVKHNKTNPVWK